MSYLGDQLPLPNPNLLDQEWWEHARNRRLCIQQCTSCGTFRHLPMPTCPNCLSFEYTWTQVSGRGTVYTYTVTHQLLSPALRDYVPYNVVLVELPDAGNVRIISNLVLPKGESPSIGQEVEVVWEQMSEDINLPRFRPVTSP
jgi:uncharacterized OB-fold protein